MRRLWRLAQTAKKAADQKAMPINAESKNADLYSTILL